MLVHVHVYLYIHFIIVVGVLHAFARSWWVCVGMYVCWFVYNPFTYIDDVCVH